ncbi:MAG: hypothetical protein ABH845_02685 [Candidatus Omnitrophota bacterium]
MRYEVWIPTAIRNETHARAHALPRVVARAVHQQEYDTTAMGRISSRMVDCSQQQWLFPKTMTTAVRTNAATTGTRDVDLCFFIMSYPAQTSAAAGGRKRGVLRRGPVQPGARARRNAGIDPTTGSAKPASNSE